MSELIFLVIGLFILALAWRSWKITALDETRDRLFDIRDNLRTWFIANGYGLDHPICHGLRNLMNAHLRFTEEARFIGILYLMQHMNADLIAAVMAELNARFETDDPRLSELVKVTRRDAARTVQLYMVKTSTLAMAFSIGVVIPTLVVLSLRADLRMLVRTAKIASVRQLDHTPMRLSSMELAAGLQQAA